MLIQLTDGIEIFHVMYCKDIQELQERNKEVRSGTNGRMHLEESADGRKEVSIYKREMKRVCCYCKKVMREGTEPPTHGVCPKCFKIEMKKIDRIGGKYG
jgi:hypothetical protein